MLTMVIVVVIVWLVGMYWLGTDRADSVNRATWLHKSHPDYINVPTLIVDCVSVAVAFIPEGLPIAVTASLTIVAGIMKSNKILCKSLKTVETLGSVSTICSDKTGTLTKNQMRVTDCMVGEASLSATQAIETTDLASQNPESGPPMIRLLELALVGALCNAGQFDAATMHLPLAERAILGDATDQAVLRFVEGIHPVSETRSAYKTTQKIPFNSKNKFMVHAIQPAKPKGVSSESSHVQTTLTIKGAPDILLPRCTECLSENGTSVKMTEDIRSKIEETKDMWSRQAKRVILLARKPFEHSSPALKMTEIDQEILQQTELDLEFVGLLAIIDPPRDEIPKVIETLRRAGIKVHMVTGDFKLTAQAIAKECGIITQLPDRIDGVSALDQAPSPKLPVIEGAPDTDKFSTNYSSTRSLVLTGAEMMAPDEDQWDALCKYDEIVFSRTTPEQKLRIVRELQARGETVGSGYTSAARGVRS